MPLGASPASAEALDLLVHELRAPLNRATAALQAAAQALAESGAGVPRLQSSHTAIAEALGALDNVLSVALLLNRSTPVEREDADIDTLLELTLAELPADQRARVQVQRDTATRTTAMDLNLMRMALRNLLTNALRHGPPGSAVTLRLADSDAPLALLIDVLDQGPGLSAELLPRLAERGARRADQPPGSGSGLGLGLYLVRQVMALHGGELQLLHTSAQGTAMRLVVTQGLE